MFCVRLLGSNCKLCSACSRTSLGDGNTLAKQDVAASDVGCSDHVRKPQPNKKSPTHSARAEIKTESLGDDPLLKQGCRSWILSLWEGLGF